MKKFKRTLFTIALGMIFLVGCGDKSTNQTIVEEQTDSIKTDTENNEQIEQGESGERIILTLGTLGIGRRLQSAVESYNAQSEKYYVEIKDYLPEYYDSAIYEASQDRLRVDLATGKGTDIIDIGNLVADELGYAGVLVDMNTFLNSENVQGKYLDDILECIQTGDAIYELSPAFTLDFIAGDGSKLGMETGWTMEEMMESFARNGRDGAALAKGGARTVVSLVEYSIDDYVDWSAGTVNFCNEEFYRVLAFGKTVDNGSFIRPTKESVMTGTHLASCEQLVVPADIQRLNWLFGEDMAVKGYPCSEGTGVAVDIGDGAMGISTYCQCQEGAWDFLDFYLEGAWTVQEFYEEETLIKETFLDFFPGFPLNTQLFEETLQSSMTQRYTDAEEPIPLLQGEGETPNFYANTKKDVEKIRELIALADRRSFSSQSVISQIIEEEISGYNDGILTAEQTAEKIQNRVQLYLDEQK